MIISFKHKGLKKLYETGDRSLIRQDQFVRVKRILAYLDSAKDIQDLNISGLRLHPLVGELKGYWSLSISGNWRIIFRFEAGNVYDVELVDYH